jgi:hypothetical protein
VREKSFSRDHSSFFGSGETEKKLSFELSQLKAQLASKEVELDSERQGVRTLRGFSARKSLRQSRGGMKLWSPCGSPLGNVKVSRSVKVLRVLFCFFAPSFL